MPRPKGSKNRLANDILEAKIEVLCKQRESLEQKAVLLSLKIEELSARLTERISQ